MEKERINEVKFYDLAYGEFLNFLIYSFIDKYYDQRDEIEIKIQLDNARLVVKLLLTANDDMIGTLDEIPYEEVFQEDCRTRCITAACIYLIAMDHLYGEDDNPIRKSSQKADLGLTDRIRSLIEEIEFL